MYYQYGDYLSHHGILKQKWGVRNGPPYPLKGGAYTPAEKKAMYTERSKKKNSIYNKKHFDEVLKKGTTMATLSWDKDRLKGADMFYAAHDKWDKHQYNALFNRPMKDIETGKKILKFNITNEAKKDIKVASEDSAAKIFKDLYSKDRDFYNYVTDKDRMQSLFVKGKYRFRGYREAASAIEKVRSGKTPTEDEVQRIYRMYNYTIPNLDKDTMTQRKKFFDACKKSGYSAILDTNDAIYGGFKARSPVIVLPTPR